MSYNFSQIAPVGGADAAARAFALQYVAPSERDTRIRRCLPPDLLMVLVGRAHANHAERRGLYWWEWSAHGSCADPRVFLFYARSERMPDGELRTCRHQVLMSVRCRKCAPCLKKRRIEWQERALAEFDERLTQAFIAGDEKRPRAWFVTLTASPENQFLYAARAEKARKESGGWRKPPTKAELFGDLCTQMGKEVQKFFKRLRIKGHELRYLHVFEPHESGRPHAHLLIYEVTHGDLKKRDIQGEWTQGFSQATRADKRRSLVSYIAKYLGKGLAAGVRIRSSLRFGKEAAARAAEEAAAQERGFASRVSAEALCRPDDGGDAESVDVGASVLSIVSAFFPGASISAVRPLDAPGDAVPLASCWEDERIAVHRARDALGPPRLE